MLELVSDPEVDLVVAGIVGTAGLRPVYTALQQGKCTALANKESLVVGGRLLEPLLKLGGSIVPVDSEHSAIFQCLQGSFYSDISRLVLTASGGPFWQKATHELQNVSPAEARRHPNWSMGAKVSIDSATMMNKALELVEAYWLFGVPAAQIDVLIHPQSIVHSLVEFRDGGMLAQLSQHDMRGAIAYALNYPAGRLEGSMAQMGICDMSRLEVHELDRERFPAIERAKRCIEFGRDAAAVMNIANEVLVEAFCQGKTSFTDIVPAVEKVVGLSLIHI